MMAMALRQSALFQQRSEWQSVLSLRATIRKYYWAPLRRIWTLAFHLLARLLRAALTARPLPRGRLARITQV